MLPILREDRRWTRPPRAGRSDWRHMGEWHWADDPQPEQPDPLGRALRACDRPRLQHESVLYSVDKIDVPLRERDGADLCYRSYCIRPAAVGEPPADTPKPFAGRVWRSTVFAVNVPLTAGAHPEAYSAELDAETVFRDLIARVERELHSGENQAD
jgi:hypothetical protein